MKFTRAGQAAGFLVLALLLASLIFRDFFIEASLLVVLMVVVAEAVWVRLATWKPQTKFVLGREEEEPEGRKVILYPDDESIEQVRLTKKVGGKAELESRVNFLDIEPSVVSGSGVFPLQFRFRTEYAGEYSGGEVGLTVAGPLGLFSSSSAIPFAQKYTVYPRVLQVAAATVRILGRAEMGETPIEMPGVGSEYYEMREYHAGDDFRSVNWKATARVGELVVVEHMREVGSSFLLILDTRSPGFRETDNLASTFLSLANSLGAAGVSFGILVHDGSNVVEVSSEQDPRASLGVALRTAVGVTKLGASPEFLELVPVSVSSRLPFAGFGLDEAAPLSRMPEVRRAELRTVLENVNPWAAAAGYVRETQTRNVVYVSGLFGDVQPLIELAWESKHYRDAAFTVANPCDVKTDETHARYRKLTSALSTAGVTYYRGRAVDLARKILTA